MSKIYTSVCLFFLVLPIMFLWIGAYIMHLIPHNAWQELPALLTICIFVGISLFLATGSISILWKEYVD